MSYPNDRFGPAGPPDNFFKTKDPIVLASAQIVASDFRQWEMQTGQKTIRGEFDADHFRKVHAYLLQDTYPWAGQTRRDMNDMALRDRSSEATGAPLTFEKSTNVNDRLDEISAQLKQENGLRGLEQPEFVRRLASYYDQYNQVAPFRGGNDATLGIITEQIAKGAGYDVRLEQALSLRPEADRALQLGPKVEHRGLVAVLNSVTTPAQGLEAELLRRPSLRELTPDPTRRTHEQDNQRDMLQSGAIIADILGGRAGGQEQYQLMKQSVDEISAGNITSQNLQVVKQLSESVKGKGVDASVSDRFEAATANLAALKGYYTGPATDKGIRGPGDRGRGSSSQQER